MTQKLRVLIANTFDPYFNLATEDWIFGDMSVDSRVLYIWRNANTIVIGRGQNAWSECDLAATERDGVKIARRHSGGGAVFQDLGNTCFTFMTPRSAGVSPKELYGQNTTILLRALERLGIQAEASGRNDLVVTEGGETFKISGSAFKESPDRVFHHGTMLLNVDLTRLGNYLTPNQKKLQAKGIRSVAARVKNLTEIRPELDHAAFTSSLIEEFASFYGATVEPEELDHAILQAIPSLSAYYDTLRSWDWIFGKTPSFEHSMTERFAWGLVELHLDTHQGKIRAVKMYTDSLDADLAEETAAALTGLPYGSEGIAAARERQQLAHPSKSEMIETLYAWIFQQLCS